MTNLFAESGYELQNNWTPTGVTTNFKDTADFKNAESAVIRHRDVMIDGEKVHMVNVIVAFKGGTAKSYKLSTLNEELPNGTKVDMNSIVAEQLVNNDGKTMTVVSCKAAK
jgi:hypothetical protein